MIQIGRGTCHRVEISLGRQQFDGEQDGLGFQPHVSGHAWPRTTGARFYALSATAKAVFRLDMPVIQEVQEFMRDGKPPTQMTARGVDQVPPQMRSASVSWPPSKVVRGSRFISTTSMA
ncbi:MAG: hypothetical protein AAFP13_04745 [Pseudomonadota bacterium]